MSHLRRLSSTYYLLLLCVALMSLHPRAAPILHPKDETEVGNLFEGDILLEDDDKPYGYRKKRGAGENATIQSDEQESYIWPNNTIYYKFSQTLPESYRETFINAMTDWSTHTCLNFEYAEEGQDHILFINSPEFGCSSYVGRKGGQQIASMSDSCFGKGHAIHEIGHSLGLWHEHSRPDRDEFIEVLYENIRATEEDNFGILTKDKFELVPDVGYDIESIMHYGPYAFAKEDTGPEKKTIQLKLDAPLDYKNCTNLLAMGQRDELSYLDKLRVNKLYSCKAEIRLLEDEGRKCIPPATIPTPTMTTLEPTSTVVTMPTPTTTQPVVPTPSKPKRLQSGSVITLRFSDQANEVEKGLKCTPRCRATTCYAYRGGSTCNGIAHQFEIVTPENPNARKILSGAKVALRSRNNPTQWLDCSDMDSSCSISRCTRNDADLGTNASFITNCQSHYFQIFGVGRKDGKLINSNHSIRLKHEYNQSYLDCSVDNKCKLSDSTEPSYKFHILH